jgi:hypothetical protein
MLALEKFTQIEPHGNVDFSIAGRKLSNVLRSIHGAVTLTTDRAVIRP